MATQREVLRYETESPTVAPRPSQTAEELFAPQPGKSFGVLTAVVQLAFIAAFHKCKLQEEADAALGTDTSLYLGVALMIFVGFGYLKTFLKAYGLGAVGFTLLISCVGIQWALILESCLRQADFTIDLPALLRANIDVVPVLVSFGALIGRVSPLQIILLVLIELPCFTVHKVCLLRQGDARPLVHDGGGTFLHVFGAYFGLAAASSLGPAGKEKLRSSSYQSDILALIGTVFLWMSWPSFVAAGQATRAAQLQALLNTVLALLSSTVMTFGLSQLQDGRLDPQTIQNATLAGGVAIGATASVVGPFAAAVLGTIAGSLATVGFALSPLFRVVDTCGVHNLHGLPGILGGIYSALVPWWYPQSGYVSSHQWVGLLLTLAMAGISGSLCGCILKAVERLEGNEALKRAAEELDLPASELVLEQFSDDLYWSCAEDVPRSLPLIQL